MARGGKLWLPLSSQVAISCKRSTSMEISAPGDVGTKLSRGNTWSVLALEVGSSVAGTAEGVSKLPGLWSYRNVLVTCISLKDSAEMLFKWAIGKLLGPSNWATSALVHRCTSAPVHWCTICNSRGNQHHTHSRRLRLYKRNLINLWTLACGQPTWFNHCLVSSVGRVPVCQAGGHGFKPRPDQQSGSQNNWEEIAAFVTGKDEKPQVPSHSTFTDLFLRDIKEPTPLFEKNGARTPRWCGQPLRVAPRVGPESHLCPFPLGRPVSRKAGKIKSNKK